MGFFIFIFMIQDILSKKYPKYLDALDIYEKEGSLTLARIIIKPEFRKTGVGSQIMTDLIDYADETNKIVVLTPSEDFGGLKSSLIRFYKRFGFKDNKGPNKNFEFREAMIREPKLNEMKNNKFKGGLSDNLTINDIANKFNVTVDSLNKELIMGIKVEMEHVNNKESAKEIAMDHLTELPNYYTELNNMEVRAKNKLNKSVKEMVHEALRRNI